MLGTIKCDNEKNTNDVKTVKKLMIILSEDKEKICELENKCERLEKRIPEVERKNNIIVFRITVENQKFVFSVLEKLNPLMEIKISERELNDIL